MRECAYMPALAQCRRAWATVLDQVSEGGTILLVTPSTESIQMEYIQTVETEPIHGNDCQSVILNSVSEKASTALASFWSVASMSSINLFVCKACSKKRYLGRYDWP